VRPADLAKSRGNGEFFAIDRRTWGYVCSLGINAAVAYLVLARGTGRDNWTTAWSAHAIETRWLLSRGRAVIAINTLKSSGAIDQTGRGGRATRYTLRAAANIPALKLRRGELTDWEAEAVENVRNGRKPDSFAIGAAEKGWLVRSGKNYVLADEPNLEPDLIWLPNSLVDGVGGEPVSPIQLASRPQDPLLLRLLVDLYHSQDLAEHGGIHWRTIRFKYERHRVCQVGPFVIWEFSAGTKECWPHLPMFAPHYRGERDTAEWNESDKEFWGRWQLLEQMGLIELVPHLIAADTAEAGVIHPLALRNGEPVEREVADAARDAATAMLPSGQPAELRNDKQIVALAPVPFEFEKVELVGLYRLRYRTRNARTGAWWARLQNDCPRHMVRYRELIIQHNPATRRPASWMQH
jgi:hypothetical protein